MGGLMRHIAEKPVEIALRHADNPRQLGRLHLLAEMAFQMGDGPSDFHDAFRLDGGSGVVGPRQQHDQGHELRQRHEAVTGGSKFLPARGSAFVTLLEAHRPHPRRIAVQLRLDRLG